MYVTVCADTNLHAFLSKEKQTNKLDSVLFFFLMEALIIPTAHTAWQVPCDSLSLHVFLDGENVPKTVSE